MREPLVDALAALDAELPLARAGDRRRRRAATAARFDSDDPGDPDRVVALRARGDRRRRRRRGRARRRRARRHGRTAARSARAAILSRAAGELRRRRSTLAALAVRECAKPWAEADADVCEAIDFLEYYAQQASRAGGAATGSSSCPASATRSATPRAASSP